MAKDLCNDLKVVTVIAPQVVTTSDITGSDVDRKGYESLTFIAAVGAEGDTLSGSVKVAYLMYHSDSALPVSTGALVAATDIIVPADQTVAVDGTSGVIFLADANAEAPATIKIGYKGSKRYVTLVADETGFTNGLSAAAFGVLGHAAKKPVT